VQVAFALLVLKWSVGKDALEWFAGQVTVLVDYATAGIDFMFGDLVADKKEPIFALQVLPVIIFLGALVGMLFYLRVIQWIVAIFGGGIAWFGAEDLTFQKLLGWVFAPVAWLIGVDWSEAETVGQFIGEKTVLNEFVAFADFGPQVDELSQQAVVITTFALAGFANFASIAIQIGSIGGLAPDRRRDVAALGLRALLAGSIVNLTNAAIAGLVVG
jgi:concentrative nucleoside transporter, CNT family